jgi:hypothetical protein
VAGKLERGDDTLCCNLLRQKYLGGKAFIATKKEWFPILERYPVNQK